MGKVRTGHSTSLDGFIAGPNEGPDAPMGEGGERLLAWYSAGDTEYRLPASEMVFKVSLQTAELLRQTRTTTGALVTGRADRVLGQQGEVVAREPHQDMARMRLLMETIREQHRPQGGA